MLLEGDFLLMLAHGGRGCAKSFSGACKAIFYGRAYPGALITIVAPTDRMLMRYTFTAFTKVLDMLGYIEDVHWGWNETKHELAMYTSGSKYIFQSAGNEPDAQKLRGGSIAAFWIDEAHGVPESAFYNLCLSLRQGAEELPDGTQINQYPLMGWVTSTPPISGKKHWLYKVFFQEREEKYRYVTFAARTQDNPWGGRQVYEQTVELLGGDSGPHARRELYGEFISAEGLVFPQYDREIHPVTSLPFEPKFYIAGVDFGYSAPMAIIVVGYTPIDRNKGYRLIADEFYRTRMSVGGIILACKAMLEKYPIRTFICDNENPILIGEINRAGIFAQPVRKGRGSQLYHKLLCSSAISMRHEGEQTFFVSRKHTPNWQFEIENYAEKPAREGRNPDERPQPDQDHAMQAWGYAESGIARNFRQDAAILRELSMRL